MMTYNQKNIGDAWVAILTIIGALLICLCITLLAGCKTRYITTEVPVVLHERDSIVSVQHFHTHDTLMVRDSIFTIVKGDTVLIERWHNLQAINHVARVDTVTNVVYKDKPVTVTSTEIKEVNRLKWWQKSLAYIGGIALLVAGWKIYQKFR